MLSDADKRKQYEQYSQYWDNKGKSWGRRGKWTAGSSAKQTDYSAFEDFDNFVEQLLKEHQPDSNPGSRKSARREANEQSSQAGVLLGERRNLLLIGMLVRMRRMQVPRMEEQPV